MCNKIPILLKFVIIGIDLYVYLLYKIVTLVMQTSEMPVLQWIVIFCFCFVILSSSNVGLILASAFPGSVT